LKDKLIRTRRLKIRKLRESDLEDFHAYRCDPEITRYQGFDTFDLQEAMDFIRKQQDKSIDIPGEWVQYGIEHISKRKLVGDCAIHLQIKDSLTAELGITISGRNQRKGYAREAMSGLMDFLFRVKGVCRIVETVDAENLASIRMLKSLSFRQDGELMENIFFKGKWTNEYRFILKKEEWEAGNRSFYPVFLDNK